MNIELWIGVLGVLIGVVGICLAYFFYIKTIRTKVLAIAYTRPISLFLPMYNIRATYLDKKIEVNELSRVYVLLWNKGIAPIEETDFIAPIEIRAKDHVLRIAVHDKDSAAAVTVDEVEKRITIHLLRPGEAIMLLIDAAEEVYRADISVEMKTTDMSVFLRLQRAVVPQIAAAIAGAITIAAVMISIRELVSLRALGLAQPAEWLEALLSVILLVIIGGIGALAAKFAYSGFRRIMFMTTSEIPYRFFEMQVTCTNIHDSWKQLRKQIREVVTLG